MDWTGNQNIDAYAFADKLEVNGVYNFGSQRGFESEQVSLIYPYKLSNPSIKWESVEQYKVGLDIGFLNDRIVANVDFYLKNTNDMLTKKPVPQTSGTSLEQADWPPVNIGKVRNKGIEFNLNTRNFVGEFTWETNLNMTFNKNEVLKLGGPEILSGVSLIREGRLSTLSMVIRWVVSIRHWTKSLRGFLWKTALLIKHRIILRSIRHRAIFGLSM